MLCERISGGNIQHLKGLVKLKNPNLASILRVNHSRHCLTVEIVSMPITNFVAITFFVFVRAALVTTLQMV